jgi:hypothetical protein
MQMTHPDGPACRQVPGLNKRQKMMQQIVFQEQQS